MDNVRDAELMRLMGHGAAAIHGATGYVIRDSARVQPETFRRWRDAHPDEARELRRKVARAYAK